MTTRTQDAIQALKEAKALKASKAGQRLKKRRPSQSATEVLETNGLPATVTVNVSSPTETSSRITHTAIIDIGMYSRAICFLEAMADPYLANLHNTLSSISGALSERRDSVTISLEHNYEMPPTADEFFSDTDMILEMAVAPLQILKYNISILAAALESVVEQYEQSSQWDSRG